jgi:hypothetical protein
MLDTMTIPTQRQVNVRKSVDALLARQLKRALRCSNMELVEELRWPLSASRP